MMLMALLLGGGGRLFRGREGYGFRMALRAGRDSACKIQALQTQGPESDHRNHIKVLVMVAWNLFPTVIGWWMSSRAVRETVWQGGPGVSLGCVSNGHITSTCALTRVPTPIHSHVHAHTLA